MSENSNIYITTGSLSQCTFSDPLITKMDFAFCKDGTHYKLKPQKDLTAFELYHINEMKNVVASHYSYNSGLLAEYLIEYIDKNDLQRHFLIDGVTNA